MAAVVYARYVITLNQGKPRIPVLCLHEAETLFDAVKALVDPIETASVMRHCRPVLRERMFDLADAELQVLDVCSIRSWLPQMAPATRSTGSNGGKLPSCQFRVSPETSQAS
jgi:hypothetical protein